MRWKCRANPPPPETPLVWAWRPVVWGLPATICPSTACRIRVWSVQGWISSARALSVGEWVDRYVTAAHDQTGISSPSWWRRKVYISPFSQYPDGQLSSLICPSHTHTSKPNQPTHPINMSPWYVEPNHALSWCARLGLAPAP